MFKLAFIFGLVNCALDLPSEQLTLQEFETVLYDQEARKLKVEIPLLLKFYAPWCSACEALSKQWSEIQVQFADQLLVLNVDCTHEDSKELCFQFNVRGYPTVMMVRNNKFYKYQGDRSFQSLAEFAKNGFLAAKDQGAIPGKVVSLSSDEKKAEKTYLERL